VPQVTRVEQIARITRTAADSAGALELGAPLSAMTKCNRYKVGQILLGNSCSPVQRAAMLPHSACSKTKTQDADTPPFAGVDVTRSPRHRRPAIFACTAISTCNPVAKT
jgi:hypothetical protein